MAEIGEKDWVLYCETNKMQLSSFSNLMKQKYNFVLCQTGKESIEKCRANIHKIKAVIQEVNLPDMSGLDVFAEIKKMNYDLPIIITTNDTSSQSELEVWRECQPNYYIYKNTPSYTDQLKDALDTIIERFNLRLEIEKLREAQIVSDVTARLQKQFEKQLKELKKSM